MLTSRNIIQLGLVALLVGEFENEFFPYLNRAFVFIFVDCLFCVCFGCAWNCLSLVVKVNFRCLLHADEEIMLIE